MEVAAIQRKLYHQAKKHICLVNSYVFSKNCESDFAYITRNRYSYEVEIKKTFEDFKADFNKCDGKAKKHDIILAGLGKQNYFSFCFETKELAQRCLAFVPEKYGVWYVYTGYYPECLRMPTVLNNVRMQWEDIALRIAASYKSKIFKPGKDLLEKGGLI